MNENIPVINIAIETAKITAKPRKIAPYYKWQIDEKIGEYIIIQDKKLYWKWSNMMHGKK
jgi:hypothetical protein